MRRTAADHVSLRIETESSLGARPELSIPPRKPKLLLGTKWSRRLLSLVLVTCLGGLWLTGSFAEPRCGSGLWDRLGAALQQQHDDTALQLANTSPLELPEESVCRMPDNYNGCERHCRNLAHDDKHPERQKVAALVGADADAAFSDQINWCRDQECAPARGCSVKLVGPAGDKKVHVYYEALKSNVHAERDDSVKILCEPATDAEANAEASLFWDNFANSTSITCLPELDALLNEWAPRSNSSNDRIIHLSNYVADNIPHLDNFIGKQWCERQLMIGNQNFLMVVDPSSSLTTFSTSAAAQGPCAGHVLLLQNWPHEVNFCRWRDFSGGMDAWLVTEIIKRGASVIVSNVDVVWFRVFCADSLACR